MKARIWKKVHWEHCAGFAMALAWLIAPWLGFAAGPHEEVKIEETFTLVMRIINFVLFAALLWFLLRKPIRNFLNQRQQSVRESLEEAQIARDEAEAHYKEMERKLALAQKEMEGLKQMLVAQGQAEKDKILANARQEGEKIRRQAQIMAEQELKNARFLLRKEAVELAAAMAETILKERIEAEDHKRLIRDYVDTLGKTA